MKRRRFDPSLLFILVVAPFCVRRPRAFLNTRLTEILRLPALQPGDWQALFSIAQSGDPAAHIGWQNL